MSEAPDFTLEAARVLADKATRQLKWASLLVAAVAIILLIDLQLKHSIARMSVATAEQCAKADSICGRTARLVADLKGVPADAGQPGGPAGREPGHAGRPGVPGVVGDAPGPAADGPADGPVGPAQESAPAGPAKRAPRHGPGTGRDPGK